MDSRGMMKHILLPAAIVTLLAGLVFWGNATYQSEKENSAINVVSAAQYAQSTSTSAKAYDDMNIASFEAFQQILASNHGEVIYLDFWASWCIPCRESFPWMNEMQLKYQSSGLKIITVNLDVDRKNAEEFLAQYPPEFDVLFDPKGQVARHYDVPGMPSSMVFNRDGKLIERHVGFNKEKQQAYQLQLETLLKE